MPRFRRRRRFNRTPVQRKKPLWITTSYDEAVSTTNPLLLGGQFVELFELVSPEDYTDSFPERQRKESCVVQRVVGYIGVDIVADAPGINATEWCAALIAISDNSLDKIFATTPGDLVLNDPGTLNVNLTRLNVLQYFWRKEYSGGFYANPGGTPTPFLSQFNLQDQNAREYDITVKRKLTTDMGLWMLITGLVLDAAQEPPAFAFSWARTLIYDD